MGQTQVMDITANIFTGTLSLDQTDDLTTLRVASGSLIEAEVAVVLGDAGHPAGDEHMWVSIDWMRSTAVAQGCDAAWAEQFDGMVSYAESKGWLNDEKNHIQVHLKRTLLPSTAVVVNASGDMDAIWAAMIDLDAQSASSDEFQGGEWTVGGPGVVGAQFLGNQKIADREWQTTAEIELSEVNKVVQLFVGGAADGPTSRWRFELADHDGQQVLRYSCQMGPGTSPLTEYMAANPEKADRVLARRLATHQENMTKTATAIAAAV